MRGLRYLSGTTWIILLLAFALVWLLTTSLHTIQPSMPLVTQNLHAESILKPHFSGDYGNAALTNLSVWSSGLFARTMHAYTEGTKKECTSPSGCSQAIAHRRSVEPKGFDKYDLFNPFISCPGGSAMQRLGGSIQDDGGKWLCTDLLTTAPCTIFSLGSNGDFSFENAMLEATPCKIFTFDCTVDGNSINERHQYHKKCIGTAARADTDADRFITLDQAAQLVGVQTINLLKIDIEGFEFDTLSSWSQLDRFLPEQVAIEIHHSEVIYHGISQNAQDDFSNLLWPMHDLTLSDLSLFFHHLASLGYGVVSREDNLPYGRCCSEFLLLKVADHTI
ncbi:hypothetical protein Ndes2526A_g00734 [Nannochloris sp. 'desiccata']